jgi:hypothetical protein
LPGSPAATNMAAYCGRESGARTCYEGGCMQAMCQAAAHIDTHLHGRQQFIPAIRFVQELAEQLQQGHVVRQGSTKTATSSATRAAGAGRR